MSIFIDQKFLHIISPRLERFSQKKPDLYSFRCPSCGDSQKNKSKCRGFVYAKKNKYFYICHNCGISTTFYSFLQSIDSGLAREYSIERYINSGVSKKVDSAPNLDVLSVKPVFRKNINLESIEELPEDHFAKAYVNMRRIPRQFQSQLYFCPNFQSFIGDLGIDNKRLIDNDSRLIIPFYDEKKNLIAIQGRALGNSDMRYITIKIDEESDKIYGLDRVDWSKKVYVVEGPIDSMFIPNCIATADANLSKVNRKDSVVLIFDNEPRNKDIVKNMRNAIINNFSVCMWPECVKYKDINDMILNDMTESEILSIIDSNTFSGLRANMELVNWKKI